MPLEPDAQRIVDAYASNEQPRGGEMFSLQQARAAEAGADVPKGPVMAVENVTIDGPGGPMPLRFYYPDVAGPMPALVYFHRGGFVFGSIENDDGLCRSLAAAAQCCVVSVGYRLAPEAKFPAAVLDAYIALSYVHENAGDHKVDYKRLAVGGTSAGACLATVVARQTKERRGPTLAFQLLLCPLTDLRTLDTPSYEAFAEGPWVTRADMEFCREQYLPDEASRHDPAASPLAATNLIGLPPAYVATAECDALRDEAEAYAAALQVAGTPVTLRRFPGMFHGFPCFFDRLPAAREVIQEAAQAMRERF